MNTKPARSRRSQDVQLHRGTERRRRMTTKPGQDDPNERIFESSIKQVDRPKKLQHLIDTQAMRFLEAMDFQSYNDLSGAFEQFMSVPMFQGDVSFSRAACALDLTAQLFSIIDTDKNSLLSREEFAYLLLKTNDANRQALAWLIENFHAFSQACFFQDQIGKEDIEASRNVFHGLKICQEKWGFNKEPTSENLAELDADKIKDYLDKNKGSLTPHETSGLTYLLDHIKKTVGFKDKSEKTEKEESADKSADSKDDKELKTLEGVLDKKSLKTLQGLKLNNFDALFAAFLDFMKDPESFRGKSPFSKAAGALDTTADALNELEMGDDHTFTRSEMLIVSKLTKKDKKPVAWFANHFDALSKLFFKSGKSKKKDILAARNVFNGISAIDERFDFEEELKTTPREQLDMRIKTYLRGHHDTLDPSKKIGLEQLLEFMEKRAAE